MGTKSNRRSLAVHSIYADACVALFYNSGLLFTLHPQPQPSWSLLVALRLYFLEDVTPEARSNFSPPVETRTRQHRLAGRIAAFRAMRNGSLDLVSNENEALVQQAIQDLAATLADEAEAAQRKLESSPVSQQHPLFAIKQNIQHLWREQAGLRCLC